MAINGHSAFAIAACLAFWRVHVAVAFAALLTASTGPIACHCIPLLQAALSKDFP